MSGTASGATLSGIQVKFTLDFFSSLCPPQHRARASMLSAALSQASLTFSSRRIVCVNGLLRFFRGHIMHFDKRSTRIKSPHTHTKTSGKSFFVTLDLLSKSRKCRFLKRNVYFVIFLQLTASMTRLCQCQERQKSPSQIQIQLVRNFCCNLDDYEPYRLFPSCQ